MAQMEILRNVNERREQDQSLHGNPGFEFKPSNTRKKIKNNNALPFTCAVKIVIFIDNCFVTVVFTANSLIRSILIRWRLRCHQF